MLELNIKLKGYNKLMKKNGMRALALKRIIKTIIAKSIFLVERESKILSPVDTGRMRASIGGGSFKGGSFTQGHGIKLYDTFGSIGPTVKYAKYVVRRRPFMSKALAKVTGQIKSIANNEVRKALI